MGSFPGGFFDMDLGLAAAAGYTTGKRAPPVQKAGPCSLMESSLLKNYSNHGLRIIKIKRSSPSEDAR
jgi:hypothetical protein